MDATWGQLIGLAVAVVTAGGLAGVLAGLLGVGGGIVIVPVLFHGFTMLGIDESVRMHIAVGTSLATIIPTSIMSARSHRRKDAVDVNLLKMWGPAILIGVLIGTAIAGQVSGAALTGIFAAVALAVAANMAFRAEGWSVRDGLPKQPARAGLGIGIGVLSVMMGIGGGTLTVPILGACRYPIHRAVGTAAAVGLIIAIPGAAGFILAGLDAASLPLGSVGYFNVIGFMLIVPATMLTAPLGARIAHAIDARMLRRAFALFLFLTSMRMFYDIIV